MVRPFADPRIGYVAAPSVCDANATRSWAVRGRLFREATLHGPVQAGSNGGWAPVCIGSHYAVRTAALKSVGGLGPELAEDYATTLWLQAAGWDGVFSIDAEAHGDGPESLEEMVVQERQWARSLATILFRYAPQKLRTAPPKARLRLGFAIFFYPLQSAIMILATALPVVGLFTRTSWGSASIAEFYLHLWPMSLAGFSAAAFLRRRQVLRPTDAKLWSWELILFQLVRWPWVLVGVCEGAYAATRAKTVKFRVTPKGENGAKPLHVSTIMPSVVLGVGLAMAAAWAPVADATAGLRLLVLSQAILYLGATVAVVALHEAENATRVGNADVPQTASEAGLLPIA
jgi:cellulose synthase/poly-beta-1,6-N-acetylglucosamine synthase-like glycosyltransferase